MRRLAALVGCLLLAGCLPVPSGNSVWQDPTRALVIDAYAGNRLDLGRVTLDPRVVGVIHFATDGTHYRDCRYHARRRQAKALGLLWGSYHMGRHGNVEQQVDDYLAYAEPQPDEVVVLDLEGYRPDDMTVEEGVQFAELLKSRIGRYPVLYLPRNLATHIPSKVRDIVSQMPLWYARLANTPEGLPTDIWPDGYALWQFATEHRPVYSVPGTDRYIDVSISPLSEEALRRAWPFTRSGPEVTIPPPHATDVLCTD